MGQYWDIVCVDTLEVTGGLGKLHEVVYSDSLAKEMERILAAAPVRPPSLLPLGVELVAGYATKRLSPIEKLPEEILDKISSFIGSELCLEWFAMACLRFLEAYYRETFRRYRKTSGQWAGKRIICIGDYAKDYPPGFLTPEEEQVIVPDLYCYAADHFGPMPHGSRWTSYGIVRRDLDPFAYLEGPNSILRNLTTKEYVRRSGIKRRNGLGFAVMSRIPWSTDPSVSIECSFAVHRGVWAGHRFDITTTDLVALDDSWRDVTEEVDR
ncbi:hypothetical protein H4R18_001204 [Coemansia javaensis]|uniref:Uncharacterized protein n=1 Tax=Coemansia javaensis TaxID=2761396 RepID=A0A9W8LLQ6_9FUNG|nr:hypothetical protein H4R18_001204 [Coemansia javaensis]